VLISIEVQALQIGDEDYFAFVSEQLSHRDTIGDRVSSSFFIGGLQT